MYPLGLRDAIFKLTSNLEESITWASSNDMARGYEDGDCVQRQMDSRALP